MSVATDTTIQAYVRLVRTAEALHADVSRGLLVEGLTASQFSTLKVLHLNGSLPQRDIAKFTLKSGGNTTMVVDNLERDGLVTRERDKADRRLIHVSLTAKGKALFESLYPPHLDRIREAMASLSLTESEQLMNLLEKLAPEAPQLTCS